MTSHPNRSRRIWQDGTEVVLRDYDHMDDRDYERRFWCPPNGGNVYEVSAKRPGTLGGFVGRHLSDRGWAITATPETLFDVISKEHRARDRKEKREQERAGCPE